MFRSAFSRLTASCLFVALAAGALLAPAAAAEEAAANPATSEDTGVIQELDLGAHTMIIDGLRYAVAIDVKVEIGGSYGAFTMLTEGMRVYYEFQHNSSTSRVITAVRELPAEVVLEET